MILIQLMIGYLNPIDGNQQIFKSGDLTSNYYGYYGCYAYDYGDT